VKTKIQNYNIVVVDFPFVDKPWESKKRPCVLLSEPQGVHDLVIIGFMTSSEEILKPGKNDVLIMPSSSNNLTKPSIIQTYKLATIMEQDILGSIGELDTEDSQKVQKSLVRVLGL
jgi:mRNA interferase MazF